MIRAYSLSHLKAGAVELVEGQVLTIYTFSRRKILPCTTGTCSSQGPGQSLLAITQSANRPAKARIVSGL